MKTSEQIIQWLKDQRIYDKFTANYNRGVQHRMSVGVYLKRTAPANLFTCAFVWHDTREGSGQLVHLRVRVARHTRRKPVLVQHQ